MRPNPKLVERLERLGYVTIDEAANTLCLSATSVRNMLDEGALEGTSVGARRFVQRASIAAVAKRLFPKAVKSP